MEIKAFLNGGTDGDDSDTCRFTLPDGKEINCDGFSPDEIVDAIRAAGITHIESDEEHGATGLYGDLPPGTMGVDSYIRWLDVVGGVSPDRMPEGGEDA